MGDEQDSLHACLSHPLPVINWTQPFALVRFCFSLDGSQLMETANTQGAVHFWDLRRIRDSLADLDWDSAPFGPPSGNSKPIRVHFVD